MVAARHVGVVAGPPSPMRMRPRDRRGRGEDCEPARVGLALGFKVSVSVRV